MESLLCGLTPLSGQEEVVFFVLVYLSTLSRRESWGGAERREREGIPTGLHTVCQQGLELHEW